MSSLYDQIYYIHCLRLVGWIITTYFCILQETHNSQVKKRNQKEKQIHWVSPWDENDLFYVLCNENLYPSDLSIYGKYLTILSLYCFSDKIIVLLLLLFFCCCFSVIAQTKFAINIYLQYLIFDKNLFFVETIENFTKLNVKELLFSIFQIW